MRPPSRALIAVTESWRPTRRRLDDRPAAQDRTGAPRGIRMVAPPRTSRGATMPKAELDRKQLIETLNGILELELAGVVRYTHYSLMIFGHARIPIVKWMRDQATEGLSHAAAAGEHITTLGGHPSLTIGKLLEGRRHDIDHILREAADHEKEGIRLYRTLLDQATGTSVLLEEYAREMVAEEETHLSEIEKMLRRPDA